MRRARAVWAVMLRMGTRRGTQFRQKDLSKNTEARMCMTRSARDDQTDPAPHSTGSSHRRPQALRNVSLPHVQFSEWWKPCLLTGNNIALFQQNTYDTNVTCMPPTLGGKFWAAKRSHLHGACNLLEVYPSPQGNSPGGSWDSAQSHLVVQLYYSERTQIKTSNRKSHMRQTAEDPRHTPPRVSSQGRHTGGTELLPHGEGMRVTCCLPRAWWRLSVRGLHWELGGNTLSSSCQSPDPLEGKQALRVSHSLYSLDTGSHSYPYWEWGNPPKTPGPISSQGPALQGSLS